MKNILVVCLNPTFQITLKYNEVIKGEVNRTSTYSLDASGKGVNVARVLTELGAKASLLTHIGGVRKEEFLSLAKGLEIIHTDSNSNIRTCISVLDSSSTTEYVQEAEAVSAETEAKINKIYEKILPEYDAVIFTGTKTPGYSKDLYPKWVKRAKEAGKCVLLDIKGEELISSIIYKPDYIKINLAEFIQTFNPNVTILENAENLESKAIALALMQKIYEKYNTRVIITRGKYDTWYYFDNQILSVENKKVEVVNTIGCGDAFSAGFMFSLLKGKSLEDSLIKAVETASKNAENIKPGSIVLL